MNIMSDGRVIWLLNQLQERLDKDVDEFERTLDKIEEVL